MEILSSTTIEEYTALGGLLFVIGLMAIIVGFGIALLGAFEVEGSTALLGVVGIIIGVALIWSSSDMVTQYKEYKVDVTDYNEIYEKDFEIIEQEGKILTIKKEDD